MYFWSVFIIGPSSLVVGLSPHRSDGLPHYYGLVSLTFTVLSLMLFRIIIFIVWLHSLLYCRRQARRETNQREGYIAIVQVTDGGDLDQEGSRVDNEKLNSGYVLIIDPMGFSGRWDTHKKCLLFVLNYCN